MYEYLHFRFLAIFACVALIANPAISATDNIPLICEKAAREASLESNVPLSVLRAISLTETGRKRNGAFKPWPWTVNMQGVGKWFANYQDAMKYVERHFAKGARSFDVGCFQINYKWHHQAFTSIEHMFEPRANAQYAAKFLSELHAEFGSWSKAAGAYHSRTPKFARKYTERFDRIRANLKPPQAAVIAVLEPQPLAPEPEAKPNNFPLLQGGEVGRLASLVPLSPTSEKRLIDVSRAPTAGLATN